MANCDNNCEALNGLYEKAVNLIAYSNLINSWVNGPANGTVNIAGKSTPTLLKFTTDLQNNANTLITNFQNNSTSKLNAFQTSADAKLAALQTRINQIPLSILQDGGGIYVDSNGKLYIDFNQMPTDKFEALLKSLRVPIWLTGNKNFYVNGATGSDTLDAGRGESASKPFQTPQACINYVTNNYNIGNYVATINIAEGTYNTGLSLPDYSRNNGRIVIRSQSGNPTNTKIVQTSGHASIVSCSGGVWHVEDLNLELRPDFASDTNSSISYSSIAISSGKNADLSLIGDICTFAPTGGAPAFNYNLDSFRATENGTLRFRPDTSRNNALITSDYPSANTKVRILVANAGGRIQFHGSQDTSEFTGLELQAKYETCGYADNGYISIASSYPNTPHVSNSITANGKRYTCVNGGSIKTQTGAADFLPGAVAGTVESSTYSWYA